MDKKQQELSNYRLEQAEGCVKSAKILAADNDYKGQLTAFIMRFSIACEVCWR